MSARGYNERIQSEGRIESDFYANEMRDIEKNRPKYTRPDEINEYLELAKVNANSEMPGQKYLNENIQNARQSSFQNVQNLTESPTSSLGAIQDIYKMELGAYNNLAMQAANYYQSNQDRLARALQTNAQYSDQEFEYNVNAPWMRSYQNAINNYASSRNKYEMGIANEMSRQNAASQSRWNIANSVIGGVASLGSSFLTGGFGGANKGGNSLMQNGYDYGFPNPNQINQYQNYV